MKRLFGYAALLLPLLAALFTPAGEAQTSLEDVPLFAQANIPGNVLLTLSVEYPTAIDNAYYSSYSSGTTYLGYFDPGKCYSYYYDSSHIGTSLPSGNPDPAGVSNPQYAYFKYAAAASNHTCSGQWSGNFLNWATMSTIDPFRQTLTGGYRAVDTATMTILERSWESGDGNSSKSNSACGTYYASTDFPDRAITTASVISGATPFSASALTLHTAQEGNQLVFSQQNAPAGTCPNGTSPSAYADSKVYSGFTEPKIYTGGTLTASDTHVYTLAVRVQVCASASTAETNCKAYGANYKPEGLMQKYSTKMRFGVVGYINDSSNLRDGGVLRAKMNFIGPLKPTPGGGSTVTNSTTAEWSSTDGTFIVNPDSADASATAVSVSNSGAMNYLNKFGENAHTYKSYDPVSELYYTGLRYFENLGNVTGYSNNLTSTMADGFPVVTSWDDPIAYSCQKNFILGIGDVNTHADGNLPSFPNWDGVSSLNEPAEETEVTNDTLVNTATATNYVGAMEGLAVGSSGGSSLASTAPSWCCKEGSATSDTNTYGMAGLAYYAHVNDIRPNDFKTSDNLDSSGNKINKQSITTFWLDVQEYQQYIYHSQFWLTAKYGGFTVPSNWSYNSTTAPPQSTWNASGNTDLGLPTASGGGSVITSSNAHPLPDNYFSAGNPAGMQSGLTTAFQKIAALSGQVTTAFSLGSAKITTTGASSSGSSSGASSSSSSGASAISYSASFDPTYWTGDVIASTLSFSGTTPTLTQVWDAQALLDAKVGTTSGNSGYGSRIIATRSAPTSSSSSGGATGFEYSNLGNAAQSDLGGSDTGAVSYLRGAHVNEGANGTGTFHARGADNSHYHVLGDIVNSNVTVQTAPGASYSDGNNPGYSNFKSTYSSRSNYVYVGANDGMLHAFDGSVGNSSSGQEVFAYVPSFVYAGPAATPSTNGLIARTTQDPNFTHFNFVDSTPVVGDVDFGNTANASGNVPATYTPNWRSILVGGLGKGGKGYYALDVTNPGTYTSESVLAGKVLWEFTDSHMGYSFNPPVLVKTKKSGWVALVTSGYNNDDGQGRLYIINPSTGAVIDTIATTASGVSSTNPSGLGPPGAFVADFTDGTTDAVYAGDLLGNLWRFDLGKATSSTAYSSIAPVLVATFSVAASGGGTVAQPITAQPLIEIDPTTLNRYVLVGTGQLLSSSDIDTDTPATNTQSFYAIVDGTAAGPAAHGAPLTRSNLEADTNADVLAGGVSTAKSKTNGWYIDLPVVATTDPATNSAVDIAARVVNVASENIGTVAFAADLPSVSFCNPTGNNYVYAVTLAHGGNALSTTGVPYLTFSGLNVSLQIVNVNGTNEILAGTNSLTNNVSGIACPGCNSGQAPKFINWREVNTVH